MHQLGSTRSVSRREYLLQTPDAFVRTAVPGVQDGAAIVHVAPRLGANFAMTTLEIQPGGKLLAGFAQRFAYVLEGELAVPTPGAADPTVLGPGGFAYLPPQGQPTLEAVSLASVVLIEKHYHPLVSAAGQAVEGAPSLIVGQESAQTASPLDGDPDLQVRYLLPSAPPFDFAVNTMTYAPGASLSQVELHYMEHGLLMMEGGGIYRLGNDWHPVTAGDFIWMAPGCPQWFAAVGKVPAKYLIYKDVNRHVLA